MGKKYSLGDMIFDLIYNIYNFDEDTVIVFASTSVDYTTCIYCEQKVERRMAGPHYSTCTCGKRYLFVKAARR